MKDAKSLLLELLSAIPDGRKVAALFTEDGIVELPFMHSIGVDASFEGRAAIKGFYDFVKQLYPDFAFRPEDIQVLIDTPDQVFAEYTTHTTAADTGRLIHHLFAGRLVAEGGQIKLLRESLNVIAAAQALLPNGLAELPPTCNEIFSVKPGD